MIERRAMHWISSRRRGLGGRLILALALIGAAAEASGQTPFPGQVGIQGVLRDYADRPVDGEVTVTFRIFDSAEGGDGCADEPNVSGCLWEETQTLVVTDGVLDAAIPAAGRSDVMMDLFRDGQPRWLEIELDGQPAQARRPIAAVPRVLAAQYLACAGCVELSQLDAQARQSAYRSYDNSQSALIAADVQGALDELDAALDAGATVPLGTVVDWYRFDPEQPVPDGYAICDGSVLDDPESPFDGLILPDLTDRFAMGVTPDRLGEQSGVAQSRHSHALAGDTDATTLGGTAATTVEAVAIYGGPHTHTWRSYDGDRFAEENLNWGGPGVDLAYGGEHLHEAHGHALDFSHTHPPHDHAYEGTGDAVTLDSIPPYVGVLRIMRVR